MIGVPVIATNVGGISSLIENEKDGYLIPANDPYLLASKISLLSHNEQDLLKISKSGRDRAHKRHSRTTIMYQLIETYRYLANKG